MKMDQDEEVGVDAQNAEMEAAFAASFDAPKADAPTTEANDVTAAGKEADAPAPAAAETTAAAKPADVNTQAPAPAAPAPSAAEPTAEQKYLNAAIEAMEQRLNSRVDRVSGNYGEVKRALDDMKKAAATPKSAAAFDGSEADDYLSKEFPELAGSVQAKIDEALKTVQTGFTAEQFEEAYQKRRQSEEIAEMNARVAVLDKAHPDRFEIQKAPEWAAWFGALAPHQQEALVNSPDPYYVSGMLSKFKSHRDKASLEAKKNQKRVEGAVAPAGVRPASQSTKTEEEAAQAAFDAQFK